MSRKKIGTNKDIFYEIHEQDSRGKYKFHERTNPCRPLSWNSFSTPQKQNYLLDYCDRYLKYMAPRPRTGVKVWKFRLVKITITETHYREKIDDSVVETTTRRHRKEDVIKSFTRKLGPRW